jgi:hypothetical protein
MPYSVIQPPFRLKFGEMSKKELKEYSKWFQEMIPQRIEELAKAVKESLGFETWQADFSPGSLNKLGEWFQSQVTTRPRDEEELQKIASLPFPTEVPNRELTNRTISLAIDVGMYLSQVFRRQHPSLKWDTVLGSKQSIDYGQPVLLGFGRVPFNPVRMMLTLAHGFVDRSRSDKGLREIYDIWSRMINK